MDSRTPIQRAIDAAVRCIVCNTQGVGNCNCHDRCRWCQKPRHAHHNKKRRPLGACSAFME